MDGGLRGGERCFLPESNPFIRRHTCSRTFTPFPIDSVRRSRIHALTHIDRNLHPFCNQIDDCIGFNNAGFLKAFPRNESIDSYISKTRCGIHGKANITEGSCLHRKKKWEFVHCSDPRGGLDTWLEVKATYPLPPNLIAEACRVDPACAGFVVTQDRQFGMLLEYHNTSEVTDIWIKVPKRRLHNGTVLHVSRPRTPYRLRVVERE